MTNFERLKEICRKACHERNACKPGFEALMQTNSVAGILNVWRDNWQDVYESKYADIMANEIASVYADMRDDFIANNVFVNEPTDKGLLIVSVPYAAVSQQPITVSGTAKCYIFGSGSVIAKDNAEVYCRDEEGHVTLTDHSQGYFKAGQIEIRNYAKANGSFTGHCYNAAYIILRGGSLVDHGHLEISAWNDAAVYSNSHKKIELHGNARLLPITKNVQYAAVSQQP
jgi:hypothetical protein